MANAMPIERLQALDNVEKEIASCIQSAGRKICNMVKLFQLITSNSTIKDKLLWS